MSLPLYLSALKLSRAAFITWALILLAYALLVTLLYDSVKDVFELQDYLSIIPEGMRGAVGVGDIEASFLDGVMDIRVFVNTEYLNWLPLMFAIYAVFYCGGLMSREAERGTLDLLLSQPLARYKLVITKSGTFISMVLGLSVVSWIGVALGLLTVDASINLGRLALAHIIVIPVILAVSGYSTLASCLFLDPRRSLAVAGAITAAMFLLNFIGPSLGSFQWLQNLSLFHHVDILQALLGGTINWTGLAINIIVAAVTFGAALVVFERRDLSY